MYGEDVLQTIGHSPSEDCEGLVLVLQHVDGLPIFEFAAASAFRVASVHYLQKLMEDPAVNCSYEGRKPTSVSDVLQLLLGKILYYCTEDQIQELVDQRVKAKVDEYESVINEDAAELAANVLDPDQQDMLKKVAARKNIAVSDLDNVQ